MAAVKEKISVTIDADLAHLIKEMSEESGVPKSQIVESSIQKMVDDRMKTDAIKTAQIDDDYAPSAEEWRALAPDLPEWEE